MRRGALVEITTKNNNYAILMTDGRIRAGTIRFNLDRVPVSKNDLVRLGGSGTDRQRPDQVAPSFIEGQHFLLKLVDQETGEVVGEWWIGPVVHVTVNHRPIF